MAGKVDGFEWDDGNRGKCEKHGLAIADIETVFAGVVHVFPDLAHSESETRTIAIGRTSAGRHVLVVFTLRQRDGLRFIRPISARYMHEKEVKHYEEQIAKTRQ